MVQTVGLWRGLKAAIHAKQSAPSKQSVLATMGNYKAVHKYCHPYEAHKSVQKCTNESVRVTIVNSYHVI